jgi:Tol biopolymer transport system component
MSLLLLAWIQGAEAGAVRFTGEGHAYHPMWSHDGRYLAFEVNRYAGNVDLFIAEVAGAIAKDAVRVSIPGGSSAFGGQGQVLVNAVWHPERIALFEASNQGGQFRLYSYQPGGGAAYELIPTASVAGDLTFPNVSRDGKSMLFIADATGAGDIRVRDTATGRISQLTQSASAEMFPLYMADAKNVVFTRKSSSTEDVFQIPATGGAEVPIVGGGGDQTRPALGEGGRVVYFDGGRGEGLWDLASIEGPGGAKRTIAKGVRLPLRARPAVSPDGKWVAFAYDDPTKADKIVLSRLDGTRTVDVSTEFRGCGEPAIAVQNGRTLLAYTALPSSGSDWRFLYVQDVTELLL